jgi:hypothetical protein
MSAGETTEGGPPATDPRPDAAVVDRWAWAKKLARFALFAFGLAAVVYVVRDAGPERVLSTLLGAGVFVPVVILLEAAFMTMDIVSLRYLLGDAARSVPVSVWARSGLVAYGFMILLPGGRAAAEVVRATQLAPYVGGARAAAFGARLQAATLLGNTVISLPSAIACFVAGSPSDALPWLVLGNGLVTGVIGGAIIFASRRSKVGGWLGQRFAGLASHGASFDEALRTDTSWGPPILFSTLGRTFQAVQYGVLLAAVGGSFGVVSALVSQGIHLVGAGLGDFVPNQVGVTEGAYHVFAPALGLAEDPARAVGIALLARFCQYVLASVGLVLGVVGRSDKPTAAPAAPQES